VESTEARVDWETQDTTMPSLHKSQRHALASMACALSCLAINAAHAEVASVYGGSDGRCGSRTANGERVKLFGHDCGAPHLAIWVAGEGLSPRMRCRAD
jgi:hypothetical protein